MLPFIFMDTSRAQLQLQPVQALSPRVASIAAALLRELEKRAALIEAEPDLRCLTLVLSFSKGRPRTVLLRTESKSELAG